jgi:hypothetical protein
MTHTFATPGTPGYNANHRMMQRFGIDGDEQPHGQAPTPTSSRVHPFMRGGFRVIR